MAQGPQLKKAGARLPRAKVLTALQDFPAAPFSSKERKQPMRPFTDSVALDGRVHSLAIAIHEGT
jgi:hypothetical protein